MSDHPSGQSLAQQLAMTADGGTDDLPRTFRRARDAREREAREREQQMAAPGSSMMAVRDHSDRPPYADDLQAAAVRRLEVPFLHLMLFCIKAVLAAIPALILLGVILWLAGNTLQSYFPQLIKMKILISFPN